MLCTLKWPHYHFSYLRGFWEEKQQHVFVWSMCSSQIFFHEAGRKQREFGCEARQTTKNFLGWLVLGMGGGKNVCSWLTALREDLFWQALHPSVWKANQYNVHCSVHSMFFFFSFFLWHLQIDCHFWWLSLLYQNTTSCKARCCILRLDWGKCRAEG